MKTVSTLAIATVLALGVVASASAQSYAPAIPTPANPTPANPIATNGSPLPSQVRVQAGRSVYAPVSGFVATFTGR